MKKYSYHQSPFYKCTTKRKLSHILRTDIKDINKIIKNVEDFTAYHSFENNGREITSPNNNLKKIQKRIDKLLTRIKIPDWVHGGIEKRSIQTNAKTHKDSMFFLNMDIKNFYPNCRRERVYQYFYSKLHMTPDVAKIMTDLTTFQDSLATGSPSSSYLSFLVYEEMFSDINKLVVEKDMIMTLFIDDITISSNEKMDNLSKLLSSVNKTLNNYDHRLNENKTKYETLDNFPMITGVSISPIGEIKVANNLRHKIINGVEEIKKNPNNQSLINSTRGRIITAQQTERDIFNQTLRQLKCFQTLFNIIRFNPNIALGNNFGWNDYR